MHSFFTYSTRLFILQVRTGFPGNVLALEPLFYKYGKLCKEIQHCIMPTAVKE